MPPRIGQRIYRHLTGLTRRSDLSPLSQETCDALSEAWLLNTLAPPLVELTEADK